MFCVWVENPLGMFSVGSFPLIADLHNELVSTRSVPIYQESVRKDFRLARYL